MSTVQEILVYLKSHQKVVWHRIRRIEAVTAQNALSHIQSTENKINTIKNSIKANDSNLFDKLASLQEQLKSQEKEIAKLKKIYFLAPIVLLKNLSIMV